MMITGKPIDITHMETFKVNLIPPPLLFKMEYIKAILGPRLLSVNIDGEIITTDEFILQPGGIFTCSFSKFCVCPLQTLIKKGCQCGGK